jgi:hypothetical protein
MRSEVKCLCIGNLVFELHSHTGGIPSARVACFLRVDRLEIAIFLQLVQYRHCHMSGVMEMSSFAYMWQTTQKAIDQASIYKQSSFV